MPRDAKRVGAESFFGFLASVDAVSVAEMGSPVQAEQAAASSLERPKRRTSTSDASKLRLEIDEQPGYQQRLLFCPATTATSASAAVIAIWTA